MQTQFDIFYNFITLSQGQKLYLNGPGQNKNVAPLVKDY